MTPIVFLTHLDPEALARLAPALGEPVIVHDLAGLEAAVRPRALLLSFGHSVIVPAGVLARFEGGAYNLHPASPDYPGRDPHHFAVYEGAVRYGATLHRMTARVDDGPIIDVEMFDAPLGATPAQLLALANEAGGRILERAVPRLLRGETPSSLEGVAWGPVKRRRADFLAMCRITPDMSAEELERRVHAFNGGDYDNLYMELHGRRFRIDRRPGSPR